jgi:hypothetical protein
VVSITPRPHTTPGKEPVPILQEAGWASGPVWTGAENLAPTGIRSPDCPNVNHLNTTVILDCIQRFNSYRAINTRRVGYKKCSVNPMLGNDRCLF